MGSCHREDATVSQGAGASFTKAQRANARRRHTALGLEEQLCGNDSNSDGNSDSNENDERGSRAFRLLNMRTGELWQLTNDPVKLETMVRE